MYSYNTGNFFGYHYLRWITSDWRRVGLLDALRSISSFQTFFSLHESGESANSSFQDQQSTKECRTLKKIRRIFEFQKKKAKSIRKKKRS
jgi:hypothetical protein